MAEDHTFKSRKFGLCVATFVSANMWLYMGLLNGDQAVNLFTAVILMYAAGSVGDKFARKG